MIHQGLLFLPVHCWGNNATIGKWCETWKLAISPLNFWSNNKNPESVWTIWSVFSCLGWKASVCPGFGFCRRRGSGGRSHAGAGTVCRCSNSSAHVGLHLRPEPDDVQNPCFWKPLPPPQLQTSVISLLNN